MEIQVPPFKEKRQFGRINIPEPMICQLYVPQSRKRRGYKGLIRNISVGGIYFVCDEKPPLAKDDIRWVIFNVIYNYHKIYRLKFHALVVRTKNESTQFAVALNFLSAPIYYQFKGIGDEELPFLDKTRILYQNYQLYKKAYEIIETTPEIRDGRIDKIRRRLDHNLYKIEQIKLATSITADLTDNFKNFAEEFYRKILK